MGIFAPFCGYVRGIGTPGVINEATSSHNSKIIERVEYAVQSLNSQSANWPSSSNGPPPTKLETSVYFESDDTDFIKLNTLLSLSENYEFCVVIYSFDNVFFDYGESTVATLADRNQLYNLQILSVKCKNYGLSELNINYKHRLRKTIFHNSEITQQCISKWLKNYNKHAVLDNRD